MNNPERVIEEIMQGEGRRPPRAAARPWREGKRWNPVGTQTLISKFTVTAKRMGSWPQLTQGLCGRIL